MNTAPAPATAWQEAIFKVLKDGGVRQIAYVPDAGHSHAIRCADRRPGHRGHRAHHRGGRRRACVSGAWLGGQRAVLLMQSSGVGNCVNMFSLLRGAQTSRSSRW